MTPHFISHRVGGLRRVIFLKGDERYIFTFAPEDEGEVMRTLGRWAANPELSLTWYDAAVVSNQIARKDRS